MVVAAVVVVVLVAVQLTIQIHIQLQELSRLKQLHAPGRLDPSAHVEARSSARIDPSAPPYMNVTNQES